MSADAASARTQPALRVEPRLSGRPLALARAGWIALVSLALALFVVSLAARYVQVRDSSATTDLIVADIGLTAGVYATYLTALTATFGIACFGIAGLILRGRTSDPMALFVSIFMALLGAANAPNMQALTEIYPGLIAPANVVMTGIWIALFLFLLLFPDGRFHPSWARQVSAIWVAAFILAVVTTGDSLARPESPSTALLILGGLVAGAGMQVYRYLRVSNPLQRQQSKWIVFGLASAIAVQITTAVLEPIFEDTGGVSAWYELFNVSVVTLGYMLVPVSIGFAILRYRLWDIDIIINRALAYGLLTASIVGVYVLTVGGIGALFQARGNLVVSLLATGVVAVLFQPLRDRSQRGVNHLMYGERDDPYAVISRLGQRLEASLAPDSVLPSIVETVREALRLPYAAITLNQDGEPTVMAESGEPVDTPVTLPLIYQGEMLGELLLGPRSGEPGFSQTDMRLLDDLARQAGIAAHGIRLTTDLQRSRERLVNAREEERRRLRRDLHDGLGPQLASQTLTIDAAVKLLSDDPETAAELLRDLKAQSQAAVADIRRLVYDLRPPALDDLGLVGALQSQADTYRHTGLEITIDAPRPLPSLPAAVEVACYRIVQEALTNTVRHANASRCSVSLALTEAALAIEVRDDGRGLPADHRSGVGLHSMRERAAELGGTCRVATCPNGGTCVSVWLPLPVVE